MATKAELARCPSCDRAIFEDHPYAWCKECGEPLPERIRALIPSQRVLAPTVGPAAAPLLDEAGEPIEVRCPFCAEKILSTAKKCKHCGEWLSQAGSTGAASASPSAVATSGGGLSGFGGFLLVIGLLGLVYALGQDTSVSSGYGERVQNLGLMNEKQNLVIATAAVAILGAVLLIAGRRS